MSADALPLGPAGPAGAADAAPAPEPLPERAAVWWRPTMDARRLRRLELLWLATTAAHVVPFLATAVLLVVLEPLLTPVALAAVAHAWVIPALYAQRGANVVRVGRTRATPAAEGRALGLLGDLVGRDERALLTATGLAVERGRLGVWVLGMGGALLVRRGALRRPVVHAFCVRATDPDLPAADRIAHLLLALRSDEAGFATVANQAFAGAPWRVRARMRAAARPALDAAVASARDSADA